MNVKLLIRDIFILFVKAMETASIVFLGIYYDSIILRIICVAITIFELIWVYNLIRVFEEELISNYEDEESE